MPGYFGVMGIPLRTGRDISDDDIIHRRRVAVLDERVAAQLWQGDAIGKRLSVEYSKQPLEVVGVAGHIRARDIRDSGTAVIYVPAHIYEIEQTLVVRTPAPLSTIGPAIKQAVEALGPGRPVFGIRPMKDIVEASIDTTRFTMLVLSAFAVASLGLAGATAATRVLRGLLYGVTPLDRLTLVSVVALVAAVARRRRLAGLARGAHRSDDGPARGVGRSSGHRVVRSGRLSRELTNCSSVVAKGGLMHPPWQRRSSIVRFDPQAVVHGNPKDWSSLPRYTATHRSTRSRGSAFEDRPAPRHRVQLRASRADASAADGHCRDFPLFPGELSWAEWPVLSQRPATGPTSEGVYFTQHLFVSRGNGWAPWRGHIRQRIIANLAARHG